MNLYPGFVERVDDAEFILTQARLVTQERRSRAVVLLGLGGVGKTTLIRQLAEATTPGFAWLDPIDIDDSEYWLLPNLERRVATDLDMDNKYFGPYMDYLSGQPSLETPRIGHGTVLAHLRQGRDFFVECYSRFVEKEKVTPVITLDTVEAIRGTDLVLSITQWMKRLPGTLFILAGRPVDREEVDRILEELEDRHQPLTHVVREMRGFDWDQAVMYLAQSTVAPSIGQEVIEKLVLLTRGHPLWLALTVSHLVGEGTPHEARQNTLAVLRKELPYDGELTQIGRRLHEHFLSQLLVLYREVDFWSEATQRLAIARWRVDVNTWQAMMADYPLSEDGGDWNEAWHKLTGLQWVRMRSNRQFATLHDALAEALITRTIPLRDKDETWRRACWQRVEKQQASLIVQQEARLDGERHELDSALRQGATETQQRILVERSIELDRALRELGQLKAAHLHYAILCDYKVGVRHFLELEEDARRNHEFQLWELLWLVMQPFLFDKSGFGSFAELVAPIADRLQTWVALESDLDYQINWRYGRHLIDIGRSERAFSILTRLVERYRDDPERAYRLYVLRGNAGMRITNQAADAECDLREALRLTQVTETLHENQAEAHKELGFYSRSVGKWGLAASSYQDALRLVSDNDFREQASIQSNWAYVQALRGRYSDGLDLVESALAIRRAFGLRREEAMALSTMSEVHRYAQHYRDAWELNLEAEAIFAELGDWPWLGLIAQQKAINLFQAFNSDNLLWDHFKSLGIMLGESQRLAFEALDICRDYNIRAYPSALNRAGRIIAHKDTDDGLELLAEGVEAAKLIADGWFHYANLIEYVELSYRAWDTHPQPHSAGASRYRANIDERREEIEAVIKEYNFFDLEGRWALLQGHMVMHDARQASLDEQRDLLAVALEYFKRGFGHLVRGHVGSHGAYAVPGEFRRLEMSMEWLPEHTEQEWYDAMKSAWGQADSKYIGDSMKTGSLIAGLNGVHANLFACRLERNPDRDSTL